MNPFGYLPTIAKEHQKDLRNEAAQRHMLRAAFQTEKPKARSNPRFLVMIKKEYIYWVSTLQAKLNEQREGRMSSRPQGEPAECG